MGWLRRFMYGRYGGDQLSWFLLAVYVLLVFLSGLPHLGVLSLLAWAVLIWSLYRSLSRQFAKRRAENAHFLTMAGPAIRWFRMRCTICRDKEHRYFRCPNCGQYLRVPRGKGRITVSCRNCGVSFEEKS
ncbi:hypothetical protein [Pseudoflavonifractor sp. MSJ-37]|uniref:hypothetical protein n=1 Tax=Pseudoflavonifractor sp. MSJ-37 TaxID=2841531 RepID=UPI001C1064F2|nr:hypothetical protein [Pseudoflavonifractor sp. MSJ-37]MBU5435333.1 hypothetical protein [Pseudoflavonifractor sp. MSJ-37]